MEDLYKEDPNSWLRRARFSKTVYHRPDPSQLPVIPLAELKLWYSEFNSNGVATSMPVTEDNTSRAGDQSTRTTTMPTLKSNPDSSLTSEVQAGSDSKARKTGSTSKRKAISDMFKEVKKTVRKHFVGPPSRERTGTKTVKSSSGSKKYFDREVCQVIAVEKSSEVH